ncbi:Proteophosphoglycan ppg4 [Rhodotorula toruloides ATCC 204091]|uniref:BY PROTMAP: gi/342320947/gb/EGU12885.1/ Proteophosphoglycan ppg4 [Rhodotorula glutinis ATCC 204091] n=1 Tax=Rhodotorula toruloides TaxID=5286 RepID=A0A0K3CED0_RHOTO|nr:Proteophosphoglycan ppg4 [Rhodotorula toruloides ATCC 204091]
MSTLTFKISLPTSSGPQSLRKLSLPHSPTSPLHFAHLDHAIRQRFGLAAGEELGLCDLDEEGDWIVLSCEEELHELLQSLEGNTRTVRLQLTTPTNQPPTVSPTETPQQSSGGEGEYTSADEWLDVGTPGDTSLHTAEAEHTPIGTPTLLFDFEDPVEASLAEGAEAASLADKTRALIEAEFPRPSLTPPAAEDPADEPVPADENAPPAFTTLPSSLSGLLSGLPLHATSLSSHLSTLLTSPDSALGRLSSLLQNPTSEFPSPSFDLRDLSASLAAVGQDVTRAIGEVVEGVRKEADAVRMEFEELRGEFEREKRRFEEEVRGAMEQARAAQGVPTESAPSTTSTATSTDPVPVPVRAADTDADFESSASRAARRAIRQAKKQHRAARRLEKAQRKLERRAKKEREAELLARAQDDLLKASRESMGQEREGQEGEAVEMSCMPGGMPASFAVPKASVHQPFVAASSSTSAYNPGHATSPASSSSSTSSTSTSTSSAASDDDKPILLTKFLLAAAELGFDVSEHATRIALTDVWCESNGRGLSRMVERACDELL